MVTPRFTIGDVVYLADSAAHGFLEAVRIAGIRLSASGSWVYTIGVGNQVSPSYGVVFGDAITYNAAQQFEMAEDQLLDSCTAFTAVEEYLQTAVADIAALQTLKSTLSCPDQTDSA